MATRSTKTVRSVDRKSPRTTSPTTTKSLGKVGDTPRAVDGFKRRIGPESDVRQPAKGSKLAKLIALLQRGNGATLKDMTKATGWQAHSVRGAMSGALRKKLGLQILSEKQGSVRAYRIAKSA